MKHTRVYLTIMLLGAIAGIGCNSNASTPERDARQKTAKSQVITNIPAKKVANKLSGAACCKGTPTRGKFLSDKK